MNGREEKETAEKDDRSNNSDHNLSRLRRDRRRHCKFDHKIKTSEEPGRNPRSLRSEYSISEHSCKEKMKAAVIVAVMVAVAVSFAVGKVFKRREKHAGR